MRLLCLLPVQQGHFKYEFSPHIFVIFIIISEYELVLLQLTVGFVALLQSYLQRNKPVGLFENTELEVDIMPRGSYLRVENSKVRDIVTKWFLIWLLLVSVQTTM